MCLQNVTQKVTMAEFTRSCGQGKTHQLEMVCATYSGVPGRGGSLRAPTRESNLLIFGAVSAAGN